jgi:hypothetical protein
VSPTRGIRVVPWSPELPLDIVIALLGLVPRRTAVRITGGCGDMSAEDAQGVQELFGKAFEGFDGLLLIGGTRMIKGLDPSDVVFGITEVGPTIRRANSSCRVLGVVPRCTDFMFCADPPVLIVHDEVHDTGITTIVHPDQDVIIAAATALTKEAIWDDEVAFCQFLTGTLVGYGGWKSLLIAYNGGGTTEREIRSTAKRGWPVLLVRESGRVCDKLAHDAEFLAEHPTIRVCERNAESMRAALQELSVL